MIPYFQPGSTPEEIAEKMIEGMAGFVDGDEELTVCGVDLGILSRVPRETGNLRVDERKRGEWLYSVAGLEKILKSAIAELIAEDRRQRAKG
jgi:hypothetical protein